MLKFRNSLIIFLSLLTFVLSSSFEKKNTQTYKATPEEKAWMEPFFKGIMLQNQAIYTLCGSKPLTMIPLENLKSDAKSKKNRIVMEDYHLSENWKKWEKVKSNFHLGRYAFFKKADLENPTQEAIYFADLTKIALLLQENYAHFKRETGLDFNPLAESLALEKGSEFWTKTFECPALVGLLLGYGMKNSFCFQWKYCNLPQTHEKFADSILFQFSDQPQSGKATFDKLPLPIFASFAEGEDEVVEKYKREREIIREAYDEKDFLTLTIQKLTQAEK